MKSGLQPIRDAASAAGFFLRDYKADESDARRYAFFRNPAPGAERPAFDTPGPIYVAVGDAEARAFLAGVAAPERLAFAAEHTPERERPASAAGEILDALRDVLRDMGAL